MLSQIEMQAEFLAELKSARVYEKFGTVKFRIPGNGETVYTIINGKIETSNVATNDCVVCIGPVGEEYILPGDKFRDRYIITTMPNFTTQMGIAEPTGKIQAIQVTEENFVESFEAMWGEEMFVTMGGWYATPWPDSNEIYFIDSGVFAQTYREVNKYIDVDEFSKGLKSVLQRFIPAEFLKK